MTGIDAGFLYMETPSTHMHTLKIAVLDPPAGAIDLDALSRWLVLRLDAMPALRRRVQPIPWALHHPVWVSDRPVDPRQHCFYHRLRDPGTMHELHEVIGRIASTPLHRDVPLWELHLVEGLEGGRVAVVVKIHHALADGVAANAMLGNVADQNPLGAPQPSPQVVDDHTPAPRELAWLGVRDGVARAVQLPGLLARTVAALVRLVRRERPDDTDVPRPVLDTPATPFNSALTSRRSFSTLSLPLDDLRAVKSAHGVTLNDVVLCVVGGALRRYLIQRDALPSRSLTCAVPVSTEPADQAPRLRGNLVSNFFTVLGTDQADPVARLHRVHRTTAEAKRVQQTLGAEMLRAWLEFSPPGPATVVMRLYSWLRAARWHPSPVNVVVSNVPGPRVPVTIDGTPMTDIYSVGPILEGIGLNVTVWSYVDRMNFTLLACPDLLPDLDELTAELRPALDELLATVREETPR